VIACAIFGKVVKADATFACVLVNHKRMCCDYLIFFP
jgi:hypothetical protein